MKRALALFAILLALPLGACGFTPLYAAPGVTPGLTAIDVIAPQGRTGHLLREELDDLLGRNPAASPAYRLQLSFGQARIGRGLRVDDVVSRYEVELAVDYRLVSAATGDVAHQGQVDAEVTYDTVDAPYAGLAAQQDGEARAAAEAARKIHLELAQYFARRNEP